MSSNNRWVISGSRGGVCVWETHEVELHCDVVIRPPNDGKLGEFAFSPVGNLLASAFDGSKVFFWRFKEI